MVDAFATYQDLESRLNRAFTVPEREWITTLLGDASTYLREDVIGLQVYPQADATFTTTPDNGEVTLPQQPVIAVSAVMVAAVPAEHRVVDGVVFVDTTDPVTITFTYGYESAPDGLKRWACVLVSQAMLPIEMKLGITVGGLSSVALDDFKVAFADAGEQTGMTLTDRNIELIRRQYRGTVTVVGTR